MKKGDYWPPSYETCPQKQVEDLQNTVNRLENILRNENWQNAKERVNASTENFQINKKADSVHGSANDTTDRIQLLEGKVVRTTQRFDTQEKINSNITNCLERIETSGAANPRTPVSNRKPQALNNFRAIAPRSTSLSSRNS